MLSEIQGLWIGPRLSTFEQLSIASFLDHGHTFRLFTYGPLAGVPEGTTVEDAGVILPQSLAEPFLRPGRAIAHFADWFRWKLLHERGGYWVDLDVVCLKPFDFTAPVLFGYQTPGTASIGVLRFPAGHAATADMLDRCVHPHAVRPEDSWRRRLRKGVRQLRRSTRADVGWGEAGGPIGFSAVVRQHELDACGFAYPVFYPVHYQHWPYLFDATFASGCDMFPETRAIHLWNEVIRKYSKFDKDQAFHPDSLVEQLKRRHLTARRRS